MAQIDWYVEGVEYGSCNCDYGCPCQFESLPTHGDCKGFEVVRIDKGHFASTELAGLHAALVYAWPGPVFKGGGTMQAIIDERANPDQRRALATILHGGETKSEATHWWVYHAMASTVHEPIFRAIECSIDIAARTASVKIPGIVESTGRPIISPATGQPHRVRIDIPNGIEFEQAEIGSASTKITGTIAFELNDTYGQFNILRHSGSGVVH
jgi:hypothetical protein